MRSVAAASARSSRPLRGRQEYALVPVASARARLPSNIAWPNGCPALQYIEGCEFVGTSTSLHRRCPFVVHEDAADSEDPRDIFVCTHDYADIVCASQHAGGTRCGFTPSGDHWLACSRDGWYVLERVQLWSATWTARHGGPYEGGWVLLKPRMFDRLLPHVPFSEFWTEHELETRLTLQQHGVDLFQTVIKRSTFCMSEVPVSEIPKIVESCGCSAGLIACKFVHRFWAMKRRALQRDLLWLSTLATHTLCTPGDPAAPISSVFGNEVLVRVIVGFAICKETWQLARERGHL